jgi:cytochrome c biogenesis protein CcmG, thiol:disulfide interchange protein DsbE
MKRFIIPLAVFLVLAVFLGVGLKRDPRLVPSPLIDKPAPAFALPSLQDPSRVLNNAHMKGQVWVLNVWASWCRACREEHPVLLDFARQGLVPLYGLNYKDQRADAQGWLAQHGNPYADSLFDEAGRVGMDFGVYGVPETFVIDKAGKVRLKHVGPVTPQVLQEQLLPLLQQLKGEPT